MTEPSTNGGGIRYSLRRHDGSGSEREHTAMEPDPLGAYVTAADYIALREALAAVTKDHDSWRSEAMRVEQKYIKEKAGLVPAEFDLRKIVLRYEIGDPDGDTGHDVCPATLAEVEDAISNAHQAAEDLEIERDALRGEVEAVKGLLCDVRDYPGDPYVMERVIAAIASPDRPGEGASDV